MNRSRPRRVAVLQALAIAAGCAAAVLPSQAQAQQYRQFKDWVAGCDNQRFCSVIGLPSRDAAEEAAYLRVLREGAPTAAASIELVYASQNPMEGLALSLLIDGKPVAALSGQPLPAVGDGYTVRSRIAGAGAQALIGALRQGRQATLQLVDRGTPTDAPREISLAGAPEALRFVDAQQLREGGVTALVAKGSKPASAVPVLPVLPAVESLSIEEIEQPLPPAPAGLPQPAPDHCPDQQVLALRLGGGATLWGVCDDAGAINYGFRMLLEQQGSLQPQSFARPGSRGGASDGLLINPGVMEDGRTLNAFNKGRAAGDCGDSSDWAWDGSAFRLLRFSTLWACRGVSPEDWPQIWTARRQ